MIAIKIPLPDSCKNCPCSYWVTSGDYEGMLMCQAMEMNLPENGIDRTGKCIVNEWAEKRPEDCPILEVILPQYCRFCGKPIFGDM